MSKEKLARRKKFGHDPNQVTYGRANPFAPQGPNNVDTDPRVAASFNAQLPSMNGMAQNPYGDFAVQSPALGAQSGQPSPAGGIAPFSGNMQNTVPGTKLNQMPANMIPQPSMEGNSPMVDQMESSRVAGEVSNRGYFANAMGFGNPGMQPVPGGSQPANIQTASTLPLTGGTVPQGGKQGGKRGQRDGQGMTT